MYKRIRDLREDNDFKQTYIASQLNIAQPQYHRYESGKRPIPSDVLISLSKIYNVSVDYLLGLTDLKQTPKIDNYSPEIKKLVQNFNKLNAENKDIILGQVAQFIKEQKQMNYQSKMQQKNLSTNKTN